MLIINTFRFKTGEILAEIDKNNGFNINNLIVVGAPETGIPSGKGYANFLNIEYDKNFDKYLYKVVGYDKLTMLTMGLFITPYGATSIREYFANGFEHYFLESKEYVQKISPSLFIKIEEIIDYVQ